MHENSWQELKANYRQALKNEKCLNAEDENTLRRNDKNCITNNILGFNS